MDDPCVYSNMHKNRQPDIGGSAPAGGNPGRPVGYRELRLEDYFLGRATGEGVFQDLMGRVRREFSIETQGRWDGDVFVLDEHFLYRDGATEHRQWRATKVGERRYEARAHDVVGVARGVCDDNTIRWTYVMRVPVGGRLIKLKFDDRMFLQRDGVLLNISDAKKFGLKVGRLCLAFRKAE